MSHAQIVRYITVVFKTRNLGFYIIMQMFVRPVDEKTIAKFLNFPPE